MVGLADLWIPILVSSVAVFMVSAFIWMALPIHTPDIKSLDDEESFDQAIRPLNIKPGLYMFPGCHGKDLKSDEFKARWKAGPWGLITIQSGPANFGANLFKCFVSYLIISAICAYLAGIGLAPGADYMDVFRVVGTAGILGYCMGGLANDFFLAKPNRFIVTSLIDGVVFALVTAGIFAWLWPDAASVIPAVTP
ncbi:MAG: hypothetical protein JJ974_02015 [Phycisphaerales bacterium]|nr:hypothetical protein [Phycisphaerales bacterium]